MENQTSMKEMQKEMQIRLEGILKEMQIIKTEEFRNSRVENQINVERLDNKITSLEERLEHRLKSQAEQKSFCIQKLGYRLLQHTIEDTDRIK